MAETQRDDADQKASGNIKKFLPLIVLGALIALVFSMGWHKYLSLSQIAENRELLNGFVQDNYILAILAYMAVYIVVVALSVPGGALLTITGGFLFGWLVGGLTTVIGATIGASVVFLIAKTSLGETLAAKAGPWMAKLSEGFKSDAMNYLLFLRLVPAFPFWLVNLAPALLNVPLTTFVIATFVGIIPGTFAFAFLGAGLDSIIDKQREVYQACLDAQPADTTETTCTFSINPGSLLTPELLAAFVALGVVAIIPVVLKKLRARKGAAAE